MKTVKVVAAVIRAGDKVLATKRGYGDLINKWEFPGGKIKEGEKPKDALKREIEEELKAEIMVHDLITTVEYDYPDFHLNMQCFWCELPGGKFELIEHNDAKWLHKDELKELDWCPADVEVVDAILAEF